MNARIEDQLRQITQRIVDAVDPERIVLFGSFAYGEPSPDSDLDLLTIMSSNERPGRRAARVSRVLRPRSFPIDILARTPDEVERRLQLGDPFTREILQQGRLLYERTTSGRVVSESR